MVDVTDITPTLEAKSDQTNAVDLIDNPRTITITKVTSNDDSGKDGNTQPISIHYEGGEGKPYKPCKTMRRLLVFLWKKDATKWAGRSLRLYCDPDVRFGKEPVGGIRISHASHIDHETSVMLPVSRGKHSSFTIKPLVSNPAEDAATKWAKAFIERIEEIQNSEGLDVFVQSKAKKLDELHQARPAEHERCMVAVNSARGRLKTPSQTDDEGAW